MRRLRLGEIAYSNLFPIFYMLKEQEDPARYEFVQGVPSALNRKIREGEIDISPSSSIEYLRNREQYSLIENHSISATGSIRSIILFSKRPLEELDGSAVLTTSQSETSVALLRIVLRKFYGLGCRYKTFSGGLEDALVKGDAYLSIGDEALVAARTGQGPGYRYDLGELWFRQTGLPFTYALWIVRKECCREDPDVLRAFTGALDRAKEKALKDLYTIALASPLRQVLAPDDLVAYWQGISYDYGEEHKKGFDLFRQYCLELGLI
jgi:chorismate dehydratase